VLGPTCGVWGFGFWVLDFGFRVRCFGGLELWVTDNRRRITGYRLKDKV